MIYRTKEIKVQKVCWLWAALLWKKISRERTMSPKILHVATCAALLTGKLLEADNQLMFHKSVMLVIEKEALFIKRFENKLEEWKAMHMFPGPHTVTDLQTCWFQLDMISVLNSVMSHVQRSKETVKLTVRLHMSLQQLCLTLINSHGKPIETGAVAWGPLFLPWSQFRSGLWSIYLLSGAFSSQCKWWVMIKILCPLNAGSEYPPFNSTYLVKEIKHQFWQYT